MADAEKAMDVESGKREAHEVDNLSAKEGGMWTQWLRKT